LFNLQVKPKETPAEPADKKAEVETRQ